MSYLGGDFGFSFNPIKAVSDAVSTGVSNVTTNVSNLATEARGLTSTVVSVVPTVRADTSGQVSVSGRTPTLRTPTFRTPPWAAPVVYEGPRASPRLMIPSPAGASDVTPISSKPGPVSWADAVGSDKFKQYFARWSALCPDAALIKKTADFWAGNIRRGPTLVAELQQAEANFGGIAFPKADTRMSCTVAEVISKVQRGAVIPPAQAEITGDVDVTPSTQMMPAQMMSTQTSASAEASAGMPLWAKVGIGLGVVVLLGGGYHYMKRK